MKNNSLTLEVADHALVETDVAPGILITPAISPDFWLFRVQLGKTQAIVGFPKFFTIGIGFAEEKDWNTNLPYSCSTEQIYEHIKHNKGDKSITKKQVLAAIAVVQQAATAVKAKEKEKSNEKL